MPTYSPDGQWVWDGQRWQPAQVSLPLDSTGQEGNAGKAESAGAARPNTPTGAPVSSQGGYTSFRSRGLGETKWFLAGCAWTLYTIGFAVLGFHLWQSAISPPPPPSAVAVAMGVAQPENIGLDVFFGVVTWIAACLSAIYAYRLWTRRARWIIIVPLIF